MRHYHYTSACRMRRNSRRYLVSLAGYHLPSERIVPYMHSAITSRGLGSLGGKPVRIPRSLRRFLRATIDEAQFVDACHWSVT